MKLSVCRLGPTPYRAGLVLQEELVRLRAAGHTGDWLLYPDHPPVLTVGRGGRPESLIADAATLARQDIEVHQVARGGDITWHGPGQLVGYLICDLERQGRDLHRFLRDIEEGLIQALALMGVEAERSSGRTGVWTAGEKLASIGVAVRKWVSYHGFALNVSPDLNSFGLIHPCGLQGIHMTSLARKLGDRAPGLAQAGELVAEVMARQLGYDGWVDVPASELRRKVFQWYSLDARTDRPVFNDTAAASDRDGRSGELPRPRKELNADVDR